MEEPNVSLATRISDLISGYLFNSLSETELDELEQWINATADNRQIFESIVNESALSHGGQVYTTANTMSALNEAKKELGFIVNKAESKRIRKLWVNIGVAAAIIMVISSGIYFFNGWSYLIGDSSRKRLANDIATGKNMATLTLANGKTMTLSEAKTGVVVHASKLTYSDGTVVKIQDLNDQGSRSASGTQTIQTPRGGTYQIVLPDGTKVWLNAASSLKFTSSFSGLVNRKVELLSGEAYFEVSKDKKHPFIVSSRGQQVEVLGTHFNINTYPIGGAIKTTLLEGSVKVENMTSREKALLNPGQQSEVKGEALQITNVNTDAVVAWKNGYFSFTDESIREVMDKLVLWYDIDVVYEGQASTEKFNGKISRGRNIAQILRLLEGTKAIQFKIEGRRVTVIQ
jgi:transmembrane sensor